MMKFVTRAGLIAVTAMLTIGIGAGAADAKDISWGAIVVSSSGR